MSEQPVLTPFGNGYFAWFCPGCGNCHGLYLKESPNPVTGAVWQWNGSMTKPTFSPSVLVTGGANDTRCHTFVRDGVIEYLSDCSHALAGKFVPMEPV